MTQEHSDYSKEHIRILRMLGTKTNAVRIAHELQTPVPKVNRALAFLYRKLEVRGRRKAFQKAVQLGLVPDIERGPIRLTKRERHVLLLLVTGKSSKEIADMLYVSKRTIDFHIFNLYDKLDATNRIEALIRALKAQVITLDDITI